MQQGFDSAPPPRQQYNPLVEMRGLEYPPASEVRVRWRGGRTGAHARPRNAAPTAARFAHAAVAAARGGHRAHRVDAAQ